MTYHSKYRDWDPKDGLCDEVLDDIAFGIQSNTPLSGYWVGCPADWFIQTGCSLLEQGVTSKEKLLDLIEGQGEDYDPIVAEILIKTWERFGDVNFQRKFLPFPKRI
jgi:hypothetical protein